MSRHSGAETKNGGGYTTLTRASWAQNWSRAYWSQHTTYASAYSYTISYARLNLHLVRFNNRHFFGNNILSTYSVVNMFNQYLTSSSHKAIVAQVYIKQVVYTGGFHIKHIHLIVKHTHCWLLMWYCQDAGSGNHNHSYCYELWTLSAHTPSIPTNAM